MKTNKQVIGTIYKEALGIPGLDEILASLGFGPDQIVIMRMEAQHNGRNHFEIWDSDAGVITYAQDNRVSLMMRGILTEITPRDVFEAGDTVTLKSGGVVMTVSKVNVSDKNASLIWNNVGPDQFGTMSNIPFACLTPADPPA